MGLPEDGLEFGLRQRDFGEDQAVSECLVDDGLEANSLRQYWRNSYDVTGAPLGNNHQYSDHR
jgi:hypothetical protein